jgi:hypothetical protein
MLAERLESGDVRWLPKLSKFQIQEGDEEIIRKNIPGWAGLLKRKGLHVQQERWQIEYVEDYDCNYKQILSNAIKF